MEGVDSNVEVGVAPVRPGRTLTSMATRIGLTPEIKLNLVIGEKPTSRRHNRLCGAPMLHSEPLFPGPVESSALRRTLR